uniref:Uncharacterized protein n=1 Tax=Avena sativa TaxID=4498 RepID=A0ACD5WJL5_AVESA
MNGEVECSMCHAKVPVPPPVSKAYHSHRSTVSSRQRALNVLLVSGDCVLSGLQPILVYMCKVDGKFKFSPVSVNFLTEITKVIFAIIMLFFQARRLKVGEKPLLTVSTFNLFLYGYGVIFNVLGLVITAIIQGPSSFHILEGHSKATMFLICNNAAQGILSSFFFKYADTILKKYSSTIATIFTGIASAVLFGHTLTINFVLGISIVIISMHQYLSNQIKDQVSSSKIEMSDAEGDRLNESVHVKVDPVESEAKHRHGSDERQPLLPV